MLDTANNTFSGDLKCDPATVSAYCGTGGLYWCGSDGSCAWGYAYGGGSYNNYSLGVAALPITIVATIR